MTGSNSQLVKFVVIRIVSESVSQPVYCEHFYQHVSSIHYQVAFKLVQQAITFYVRYGNKLLLNLERYNLLLFIRLSSNRLAFVL